MSSSYPRLLFYLVSVMSISNLGKPKNFIGKQEEEEEEGNPNSLPK